MEYITISAMAVNSSTTTTVQDENGQDIVSSVKVWVGPKVKSVNVTERMIAYRRKDEGGWKVNVLKML